ncbi:glycosyltransferase family 2 protein [Jannaschia rubra]|uniref:glycosyltransferase family 2 protein n=1 Tax=Jannaschia rubra TaxID=282197 RepID=UPI002493282F|nr:glycosyltransferase family 2 protein [Jannaschia rubra]
MIETRTMNAAVHGDVTVLDAVGDAEGLRLFLAKGTDPARLRADADVLPHDVVDVNGSLRVTCRWDGGDRAPLPLTGCTAEVTVSAPEPELFVGANVLMGIRNGESIANLHDWMRFHAEMQGVDAILILDRARPGEPALAPVLNAVLADRPIPGLHRVVIVACPLPLGGLRPSERHPVHAPDAPGKGRMTTPESDPWTSPVEQTIVLEALRWRFLTAVRAVAFIDVCDLLAPAPLGRRAFDLIDAAKTGVITLSGGRIYPWRVRKGQPATFGDHVCDQFDKPESNRRWVAAPGRIPETEPFRMLRVGKLKPGPRDTAHFHRAMAVRMTEGEGQPLAARAGLVLDDTLLSLARTAFGHDPVLPPVSEVPAARGLAASLPGRTAIVTCMKNEGPFILEWIAYHRAIGVDDFLVYSNDCTDGTDRLLDLLQDHGIVAHRQNPFREMDLKPQNAALEAAEGEAILDRAGWAICMDVDEFLNIHAGAGRLRDLYAAVGDANMISATWRLFGNSDLHGFEDEPTIARFDRCAPHKTRKPHQAWGFKTLFRNLGIYRKMGVHRPKGLKPDLWQQIRWVNGSGKPMPRTMLRNGWRSTNDTYGYDLVTLNHYAVRDAESFLVKRDRGRVNHVARDQGLGYWFRMNNNAEHDTSIRRMLPALEAELARLRALPGVAAQHNACVAAHRARIAALRTSEAFGDFYAEITSPRMERLSRLHAHFSGNVFLAEPDCLPDRVWQGEVAPDDFFAMGEVEKTAH